MTMEECSRLGTGVSDTKQRFLLDWEIAEMPIPLGLLLKQARQEAGLSLREVARRAGLSPGQLSQIETGVRKSPGFLSVAQAAAALSISLDDLAGSASAGDPAAGRPPSSRMLKQTIARIRRVKSDAVNICESVDAALRVLGVGEPVG